MRRWIFVLFVSLAVGIGFAMPNVMAQSEAKPATRQATTNKVGNRYYRKKTVVNFIDTTISGDLTRPDGEYISALQSIKLGRLIQLREDWKKRISQASNDL